MAGEEPKGRGIAGGLTNYGDPDFAAYLRRSFARSMGYSDEALARPIVGIANTYSGFNNCHRHFPELLEAVKRGVLLAGGLPVEFPTISLGEVFLNPTSLKFRNLMAMGTEEMIRAQPIDAVVLMGGCDKTVPAQLMAALSADVPTVQLVAGPMSTGRHKGERLGACTDCRRFWARFRAGEIDQEEIGVVEGRLATTAGTCAVMGTASTMACIAETLGLSLPRSAAIPAVHADRLRNAEESGKRAVALSQCPIESSPRQACAEPLARRGCMPVHRIEYRRPRRRAVEMNPAFARPDERCPLKLLAIADDEPLIGHRGTDAKVLLYAIAGNIGAPQDERRRTSDDQIFVFAIVKAVAEADVPLVERFVVVWQIVINRPVRRRQQQEQRTGARWPCKHSCDE